MTGARTKTSKWIYRITLSLLVVGTLRHGQFMYDQFSTSVVETSASIYWTALLGIMSGTIALALAAVAMLLRSGAVVWLLGLQFGLMCITVAPSFLTAQSQGPALIALVVVLVVLAIGAALFTYLIRKSEIRPL